MLLVFILLMEASGIFWYMFKKTYVVWGKKEGSRLTSEDK